MGKIVARCAADRDECAIVAGIDKNTDNNCGFHVFSSAEECDVPADVLVDFSHPSALESILLMATQKKMPLVIATTGLNAVQVGAVRKASEIIPVFHTANMSLGINLLRELAAQSARVLGDTFDIEIIEKHHNKKIDAPSGTALMLADAISEELKVKPQYQYDRHAQRKKRTVNEIGLHAVRGGTIVGDHDIIFAGQDELITLSHHAASKEIFANGTIGAAMYICTQPPGLYDMTKLIQQYGVARMDVTEGINLVTFRNLPCDKNLLVDIFNRFASNKIDIDMISQANPVGENITISFTCPTESAERVRIIAEELQGVYPDIQSVVDSDNCKIVLSGSAMKDSPGVFSRVISALAPTPVAIKQITTAETEISLLVAVKDLNTAVAALTEAFGLEG